MADLDGFEDRGPKSMRWFRNTDWREDGKSLSKKDEPKPAGDSDGQLTRGEPKL